MRTLDERIQSTVVQKAVKRQAEEKAGSWLDQLKRKKLNASKAKPIPEKQVSRVQR